VLETAEVITRFEKYLAAMHMAFDAVKVGDNPELSAEEVWEQFVELTEEHVMPLETGYAPAPVDEDGACVGCCLDGQVGGWLTNQYLFIYPYVYPTNHPSIHPHTHYA